MKPIPRWLPPLGATVLRALGSTWRVVERFPVEVAPRRADRASRFVYVIWHCSLLPLSYQYRGLGVCIPSSQHRDGEIGARIADRMGFQSVRGSSTRGAARIVRALLEFARDEPGDIAITPDGPRGPARKSKPGALFVAGRLGWPIVPVAVASRPCRRLNSWDRFQIPLPFARVAIVSAPPLEIEREASTERYEELCREIDRRLSDAEAQAQELVR